MRFFWRTSAPGAEDAPTKPMRCSFCNKHQDEVARLIAGPAVFICDACVEVCLDILADDSRFTKPAATDHDMNPGPPKAPVPADPTTIACALCRTPVPMSEGLTIPGRGMLCAECESLVVLAVDNRFPEDKPEDK